MQSQLQVKVVVGRQLISVGDVGVGKSCIIKRYCEGRFVQKYITTIGVDYGVKKVSVGASKIAVNFFDLSGSPEYEEIRNPFFEDAQAGGRTQVALLVFDLESRKSFGSLGRWEAAMRSHGVSRECVVYVLGNKSDSRNAEVEPSEGLAFARKNGFEYVSTSAATGDNVNEVFEKAFAKVVQLHEEKLKAVS